MSSDAIIFWELALTLGIVVGFGCWELYKLKKHDDDAEDGK